MCKPQMTGVDEARMTKDKINDVNIHLDETSNRYEMTKMIFGVSQSP